MQVQEVFGGKWCQTKKAEANLYAKHNNIRAIHSLASNWMEITQRWFNCQKEKHKTWVYGINLTKQNIIKQTLLNKNTTLLNKTIM